MMSPIMAVTATRGPVPEKQECRAMKNLPLGFRKKLHYILDDSFALGTVAVMLSPVVTAGMLFSYGSKSPADPKLQQQEYEALHTKLLRLPALRQFADWRSAQAAELEALPAKVLPPGANPVETRQQAGELAATFQAAALELAVEVTHARKISLHEMMSLNNGIESYMAQKPASLLEVQGRHRSTSWLHIRSCQAEVMSAPGFTPTVDSARHIVSCAEDRAGADGWYLLKGMLSLSFTGLGGAALRQQLRASVTADELALVQKSPAPRQAQHAEIAASPATQQKPFANIAEAMEAGIPQDMIVKKPLRLKPPMPV